MLIPLPLLWIPPILVYIISKSSFCPFAAIAHRVHRLVQACLSTGAYCVIDLHNYGKFSKLPLFQEWKSGGILTKR
jgi:hypothetical protein